MNLSARSAIVVGLILGAYKASQAAPIVIADAALAPQAPISRALQDDVLYFVIPDRFENGDTSNDYGSDTLRGKTEADIKRHGFEPSYPKTFHGGDLAGLNQAYTLDYLQGLGISAIWITPPFENVPTQGGSGRNISAGFHGYWIKNFMKTDPHYGTDAELKTWVDTLHGRGMKAIVDIVTNHTANVITYDNASGYRNKSEYPYRDKDGIAFNDDDFQTTDTFPQLSANTSFPYKPLIAKGKENFKFPEWLNNPIYYHNRGNVDDWNNREEALYGDFNGLDDLFTQHPDVRKGMIDIFSHWAKNFKLDGYRIDTAKHVNLPFWTQFAPAIRQAARDGGTSEFFQFGESYSFDAGFNNRYSKAGKLDAPLDFPAQSAIRNFASLKSPSHVLRDLYAADDLYTDADSSAQQLPVFLGNHDMGRFCALMKNDNRTKNDDEKLARIKLAYAVAYFARGIPVVYYGDEQGFCGIGKGDDYLSREDMLPSKVAEFKDVKLLGSHLRYGDRKLDNRSHPIYQALSEFAKTRKAHKALRRGAQIHRYSSDQAGIYAFSRIDRDEKREYIVAVNNSDSPKTASLSTYSPATTFKSVLQGNTVSTTSNATGDISINVPATGMVVLRAEKAMPKVVMASGDWVDIETPITSGNIDLSKITAKLRHNTYSEVTFAVKVGNQPYQYLGTDSNPPYRVFTDLGDIPSNTEVQVTVLATDAYGVTSRDDVVLNRKSVGTLRVHYQRKKGDYDGWGLHLWGEAVLHRTNWEQAIKPVAKDAYGVVFEIPLRALDKPFKFIVHKGDQKDTLDDRHTAIPSDREIWLKEGDKNAYDNKP